MITIHTATTNDISQIMKVERDAFIPSIQEREDVFLNRIQTNSDTFLVFKKNENIIGYLCAEYIEEIPHSAMDLQLNHLPKKNCSKKILYISSFAIIKSEQGNGLGKMIWTEGLKKLSENAETKNILLLVNALWEKACHIYESSGFNTINTFQNFFPTEESNIFSDGILMIKEIN